MAHIPRRWTISVDDGPYLQIRLISADDGSYTETMLRIYRYAAYPRMMGDIWRRRPISGDDGSYLGTTSRHLQIWLVSGDEEAYLAAMAGDRIWRAQKKGDVP